MTHPGDTLFAEPLEQLAGRIIKGCCLTIFPGGIVLGGSDLTAQIMGHQLAAIADPQNRNPQLENSGVYLGRIHPIHAAGASGKNDADGSEYPNFIQRHSVGFYLTVDITFTHAAGDKLVVLTAKVQYQYFLCHVHPCLTR